MIYLSDDENMTLNRILNDGSFHNSELTEEKVKKTLENFQGDEIATSVFLKKYALRDDDNKIVEFTLDEAKDRWANAISVIDSKSQSYFRELYEYFLPSGRQMYALGNKYVKNASYTNCYVTSIEDDSIEGIFNVAGKIAKTYSYGGGIGFCIGALRPKGARVSNSAKFSTGAVSFMELYSITTGLIGQNGRRGALLLSIPVNHPDVEDFIEIKHGNNDNVKHANISIKLTDDFMNAVVNNLPFKLEFTTNHQKIEKIINSRDLWNKIVVSAHESAEPGLMFWDSMTKLSPSDTYEQLKVSCCNPCGEQILPSGGACCLGSLLLHKFVKNSFKEDASFDFNLFSDMIHRSVRHLDNIVELNIDKHPLAEQKRAAKLGRRIGLGITGLADCFAALNIKYDTPEALEFADKLSKFKMIEEYKASIELSKERGSFLLFNPEKHYERGFCKNLPEEIKEMGRKFGQRNVAISTIAPSGSLSIIAQCSSGIEPFFALSYKRYCETGSGVRKEFTVYERGVRRYLETSNMSNECELPECWIMSHQVNYKFRVKLQGVLQKYIDASISSTINLPRDVSVETVSDIYLSAWKECLKGITVYREGSREGVLVTDDHFSKLAGNPNMDTVVYRVRAEGGDKFYIPVSYKDGDIRNPYQVFVLNYKAKENDRFSQLAKELKIMLLETGVDPERIKKYSQRATNSLTRLTRYLSLSLKTGKLNEVCKILNNHAFIGTLTFELYNIFSKSINIKDAEVMRCPDCGSENLRMEEGCKKCLDCNWTGCG